MAAQSEARLSATLVMSTVPFLTNVSSLTDVTLVERIGEYGVRPIFFIDQRIELR
jgi:hypothetical protein